MIGGEPYTLGLFDTAGMSFLSNLHLYIFCSSRVSSLCNYYPLSHYYYVHFELWSVSVTLNGKNGRNSELPSHIRFHRLTSMNVGCVLMAVLFLCALWFVLLLSFILPTQISRFVQCISVGNIVRHVCICFLQVRRTTTGYDLWVIPRQTSSLSVSPSCPPLPLKMSKKRQV